LIANSDQSCDVDLEYKPADSEITLGTKVLQAEITLHPGEMNIDICAWAHQVAPLADE